MSMFSPLFSKDKKQQVFQFSISKEGDSSFWVLNVSQQHTINKSHYYNTIYETFLKRYDKKDDDYIDVASELEATLLTFFPYLEKEGIACFTVKYDKEHESFEFLEKILKTFIEKMEEKNYFFIDP